MIAVLDYGIGNLRSAQKALQKVGADALLVSDGPGARGARGVVLPGVGAFGRCMEALRASGLDRVALDAIDSGTPFLGICVGLQMLYRRSEESPEVKGLGVMEADVRALPEGVKRPQMQWNVVQATGRASALMEGLAQPAWAY
ncbi:MAG: imidazole glycerol phosphate synthase subunit HisH, partial [Actinomycetota bacterium]|nr:imidazole glycerol phosphate synthase subunit HisH [Actinomycetota bacterium]